LAKLPDAERAFVEPEKLRGYLLSPDHDDGAPKGRFLAAIGFVLGDADVVEAALLVHAAAHDAEPIRTPYGVKYHVDGPLTSPTGRIALVRTVWQIDEGTNAPRFVTLKPLRNKR
jgi:hypothetical protein